MSLSELLFLALGLVFGIAAGALLLDLARARAPRPEVRLTVTHNALPLPRPAAPSLAPAGAVAGAASRYETAIESDVSAHTRSADRRVAVPVAGGVDPAFRAALAARPVAAGAVALSARASSEGVGSGAPNRAAATTDGGGDDAETSAAAPAATARPSGPCAEARRVTDERCTVAARARAGAEEAAEELRRAKREYDELHTKEAELQRTADPRGIREAKDEAQAAFRRAQAMARSPADLEAAASTWLHEIDRINRAARGGTAAAAELRRRGAELVTRLETLTLAADAARISAETSRAACLAAREALAACEEAATGADAATALAAGKAGVGPPPRPAATRLEDERGGVDYGGRPPQMLRLLQGDRDALARIVTALAGNDADERRRWQLLLTDLVDAILARAIEEGSLDFPVEHPFWGDFTRAQCRDIARALASLGHRFDGLGGFADGRAPTQRDLALAVGYAGLDPFRIRHWPDEAGFESLYREVSVAADEYLIGAAGDLSLGEMVALLERRAENLTDLWNAWGRVRPLLLATTSP